MKKKLYLLTIATALTLSMTACGNKTEETQEPTDTTVVEVADLESTIVEETTVTETTVVEEEEFVTEETTNASEEVEESTIVEEPTIVEESTSSEEDEFVPYTAEDIAEWDESDKDYIMGTYKFLCYHNSNLKDTDDLLEALNTGVMEDLTTEDLLTLINEDFSKAYDVIEKCGIDVETHDGRTVKATEIRGEIVDYDTFWEQLNNVTSAGGSIAVARGEYADGIDAINAGEITDYTTARYHLDNYSQYSEYVDFLQAFAHRYLDLTSYLH